MANELSRVGDRLARARERTWNAEARVWLPPHARREPTRAERDRSELAAQRRRGIDPEARRDAAAESKRAPSTLVAIHVEVRHPVGDAEPTARVIDAHVAEVDDQDDFEYADPAPVDEETPVFSAPESQPVFALPAFTREAGATPKQSRASGVLHYLSARALTAYLTQQTFVSAASREPRLLDLRA